MAGLKQESGRDIWLMGGGVLFRSLLDARLVAYGTTLRLTQSRALATGIMMLSYDIVY